MYTSRGHPEVTGGHWRSSRGSQPLDDLEYIFPGPNLNYPIHKNGILARRSRDLTGTSSGGQVCQIMTNSPNQTQPNQTESFKTIPEPNPSYPNLNRPPEMSFNLGPHGTSSGHVMLG